MMSKLGAVRGLYLNFPDLLQFDYKNDDLT